MVVNDDIRSKLSTWTDALSPFIESSEWDQIFSQLKAISKSGKMVIPKAPDLFRSLQLCDRNKVKAIILLQCPYATLRDKVVIADGIPMNCQNIHPYQQPSLYQWWQAIEKTYGFNPDNELRSDLRFLLEEEHVLLINSALSVEKDKVDSHAQLWEPFTRYLLEEVVNKFMCGLPIVLVGLQAQKYEKYINPMCHHILKVEHMAAASYQNRMWNYNNMFNWINEILKSNNGPEYIIKWTRKKKRREEEEKKLNNTILLEDDLPF